MVGQGALESVLNLPDPNDINNKPGFVRLAIDVEARGAGWGMNYLHVVDLHQSMILWRDVLWKVLAG